MGLELWENEPVTQGSFGNTQEEEPWRRVKCNGNRLETEGEHKKGWAEGIVYGVRE